MVDLSIIGAHRSQPGVAPVYTARQHGSGWSSHAHGIADVCAHPMFSNSAHTSNTALYPDGTHFSQTAQDVIAGIICAAVRVQLDSMA